MIREIKKVHEERAGQGYICQGDMKRFKQEYIEHVIEREKGDATIIFPLIVLGAFLAS